MSILVTGAAGFIGYHTCHRLLSGGAQVVGVDLINDYYDPALKEARLQRLQAFGGFEFHRIDLTDKDAVQGLQDQGIMSIVHLAAQAGVRHSLTHPFDYLDANLTAWLEILELARAIKTPNLILASSSSVYGANEELPFQASQCVDRPLSLYAASKRGGELLAHSYAHLYGIPTTIVRLFSVYGPWGRPDMSLWLFAKAIKEGRPIDLYNEGNHRRDFTYVDDVVDAITMLLEHPATPAEAFDQNAPVPDLSDAPYRIYNVGNDTSVELLRYVELIEQCLGKTAIRNLLPKQPGDVEASLADIEPIHQAVGWAPSTPVEVGIPRFIEWFNEWNDRSTA